jgi:hypothetical protein
VQGRTPNPTRMLALASLAAAAALLSACGSDESPEQTGEPAQPAPAASSFPKANGTLDDLTEQLTPTDQIVAAPAGAVFTPEPKPQRFGFGLFNVDASQISDAEAAIYAAHGADGDVIGPFPARVEDLETEPEFVAKTTADDPEAARQVYVADVPLDKPGEWRLLAAVKTDEGIQGTLLSTDLVVEPQPEIPDVGEEAPSVHTPTLEDVGADVESIDTRVPPSSMHGEDLADVLGEKPVVLLFATPALCVSRVCGPVVDVAEQVKSEYGDDVAFIHMEVYEDNVPSAKNVRSQLRAYGLQTEPWLFVIDADGNVSTRIEGAFSVAELEAAVERALG